MNKITLVQHNVNNWKSNKFTLANIYNQIQPDIILINEHSCTNKEPIKIFNYNVHKTNINNEPYAGCAIATRIGLPIKLIDGFNTDFLAIEINTAQGAIVVATSYSPPRMDYLDTIDFHRILSRKQPVYFIGDINARHRLFGHRTNPNNKGKQINDMINQNKCIHIGPDFATMIKNTGITTPDIALTNLRTFHNCHLKPGPITPSDHIPIIATITVQPITIPIKPRKQYHRADWNQYKNTLSTIEVPNEPNPTLEEIDQSLENWTSAVQEAADMAIPTITKRAIPGIKPDFQTDLLQIQYDATLRQIDIHGPHYLFERRLIELRRELQLTYRHKQQDIWNNLVTNIDLDNEPSTFWKSVKRMQGNDQQTTPYLKDQQQNKYHTNAEKEPLFRNHWQTIFTDNDYEDADDNDMDFYDSIKDTMEQKLPLIAPFDTGNIERLNPQTCPEITLTELNNTINSFKQKTPGPTGITANHLKQLPPNMKHFLRYIFNNAISAGYFPDALKRAIMIFIPKSTGSQHDVKNYRPISLLDVQGKVLDKILNRRFTAFLEQNNILNPRQHGFRKNRGTHTALAVLQESISRDFRQQHKIDIILRDVTKAFDKVWHLGLKYKISELSIHPCYIKILSDYLTDRTASIKIGNYIGPPISLETGVPQGACLSPTLYSFYTHDIPEPIANTDYICFADDITQITSGKYSHRAATQTTQNAIEQINKYERKWKIKTNKSKFKIIPLSRTKTYDIFIDDTYIPYSTSGKILGLNITTKGINNQVPNRRAIAFNHLTKLQRFRKLSTQNKTKLYTATARAALIYPPVPLHTISTTQMKKLQTVQNKALKFITNTHWQEFKTARQLHHETKLPPINRLMHKLARNTWHNIKDRNPEIYNSFPLLTDIEYSRKKAFPSSKRLAEQPPPIPLYS